MCLVHPPLLRVCAFRPTAVLFHLLSLLTLSPPPRFPVVALYHSRVWVVDGMWYRSLLHNAQLIQKEVDEVVLVGGRYGNGVI